MSTSAKRLAERYQLPLLAFAGTFLLTLGFLAIRVFQTGAYFLNAFFEKCLAKCSQLMTLDISALDMAALLAVLCLARFLAVAIVRSVLEAKRVRLFTGSLTKTEISRRFHSLLQESGLPPGRVVFFSGPLSFACTAGLLYPKVYVSTGLVDSLNDEEVKAVLRHEQSHLKRRDPLLSLIVFFIARFFLFLPWARKLLRTSRKESELIADGHALSFTRDPSDLASALIKSRRRNRFILDSLPAFAEDDFLGERLSRILNVEFREPGVDRSQRFSWQQALAGVFLVLSLAILVIPAEKGLHKATPWLCPHSEHASCCVTEAPRSHGSHCRS